MSIDKGNSASSLLISASAFILLTCAIVFSVDTGSARQPWLEAHAQLIAATASAISIIALAFSIRQIDKTLYITRRQLQAQMEQSASIITADNMRLYEEALHLSLRDLADTMCFLPSDAQIKAEEAWSSGDHGHIAYQVSKNISALISRMDEIIKDPNGIVETSSLSRIYSYLELYNDFLKLPDTEHLRSSLGYRIYINSNPHAHVAFHINQVLEKTSV